MPTMTHDLKRLAAELQWLKDHPDFDERPATIREFVGPDYLNIANGLRPSIMAELEKMVGRKVRGDRITEHMLGMYTGGIGVGKGGRASSNVLTSQGWVTYSSLKVGDNVIGSNGLPTTVTGVYPRGILQLFRVTFTDNSFVDVDGDHLWSVSRRVSKRRGTRMSYEWRSEIKNTEDLYMQDNLYISKDAGYKYRIPLVEPVHFKNEGEALPIDPYTLGVILGDGSICAGAVRISGDDLDIGKRIQLAHPDLKMNRCADNRSWTLAGRQGLVNRVYKELHNLNLAGKHSYDKFIPEIYLRSTPSDRLELLRGLMDADGSAFKLNSIRFNSNNKLLASQVLEIVRSLGGVGQLFECIDRGRKNTEYYVSINLNQNPFWLKRKADLWRERTNQPAKRAIKSITKIDQDEVICISVDAKDNLYVTENYTVTHNTTVASIILPYLTHWVLCLKDPQTFYDLLPGSRIAFMQMSTSGSQAKEVIFGDIKARIEHSPWFQSNYPFDPKWKNQLRFSKEIWILPGDSEETTFEGYNILGGILDEADSHKLTADKDYAEDGFNTIYTRMTSRFQDRGFLLCIGAMKKANGFAARKYQELSEDPRAYVIRMSIWESFGWDKFLKPDGTHDSFFYDSHRKEIVPNGAAKLITNKYLIEIPNVYLRDFQNNPEKALRDLAGVPPATGSPFISLTYRVDECRERWKARYPGFTTPVNPSGKIEQWFYSPDTLKRVVHLDLAYSAEGDGAGICMGHVAEMMEVDNELKPYIVIDMIMRIHAPAGQEIFLGDIRRIVYDLRDIRKFRIKLVSTDGFESTDTRQQFERRRIETEIVSVDKTILPYHDLREAIYENRLEFPEYMIRLRENDSHLTEIAVKELIELIDNGKKIDHPPGGSKDVADAMAGVVYDLMGNRSYHRRKKPMNAEVPVKEEPVSGPLGSVYQGMGDLGNLKAPIPPSLDSSVWKPPTTRR